VKDPVKRVSQGIQVVLLFQRNCGNFYIDFPADGMNVSIYNTIISCYTKKAI